MGKDHGQMLTKSVVTLQFLLKSSQGRCIWSLGAFHLPLHDDPVLGRNPVVLAAVLVSTKPYLFSLF